MNRPTIKKILNDAALSESEKIDQIFAVYTASTSKLKTEEDLQKAVDEAKKDANGEDWKAKYDAEVIAHTATKTTHETEKTTAVKRAAARQALKALGAHDEDLDTFLLDKVDYDKVELDGDKVKDTKAFEPYKEQYKRYFGDTVTVGAGVATPPKSEAQTKDLFVAGFDGK